MFENEFKDLENLNNIIEEKIPNAKWNIIISLGLHSNSFIIFSTVFTAILCIVPFQPECVFAITFFTGSKNNNRIQSAFVPKILFVAFVQVLENVTLK